MTRVSARPAAQGLPVGLARRERGRIDAVRGENEARLGDAQAQDTRRGVLEHLEDHLSLLLPVRVRPVDHVEETVRLARLFACTLRALAQLVVSLFRNLEDATGLSTGYLQTGTLHLALSEARRQELLRQASTSRGNGIRVDVLTPEETVGHFPLLSPDGLLGSLYYPDEGRATATDITMSLARGARLGGSRSVL
mgnify:CR=1 FL=1